MAEAWMAVPTITKTSPIIIHLLRPSLSPIAITIRVVTVAARTYDEAINGMIKLPVGFWARLVHHDQSEGFVKHIPL